jgi:N-acylneuraminate cytidylyltransferase/CMP-N,N'-diacetyllegionaminic acid synthase
VEIAENGEIKMPDSLKKQIRRQDVKSGFRINGSIYLTSVPNFLNYGNFYSGKTYPYFMNPLDSVDIDDSDQFYLAKLILHDRAGTS